MQAANNQILTVAQMRAAEQSLIDGGETVDSLMLVAGRGAAEWVWRVAAGRPVTVLCGPGNNGGDGYVIAEAIRKCGGAAKVVAPMAPTTDAAKHARNSCAAPIVASGKGVHGGVLVDCLFGSGLTRELSPELLLVLRDLARSHTTHIAIDMPSGIESDSGRPLNEGLPYYDLTISLGAWKYAHWLMPALKFMGARRLVPIGVTPVEGAAQLTAKPVLSEPAIDAHKYSRGLLAAIAGEMPGAAALASQAAMHAGAGYVKLFSDRAIGGVPAALVQDTSPLADALADKRIDALLAGPGLGRSEVSADRLTAAIARDVPMVLDADALMLLAPEMVADRNAPMVATPHEGELGQLCRAFDVVAQGKIGKTKALARKSGMVVLAKGPDTLAAAPDGRIAIAPPASPWLSTAGTGDVLAGIIASRLATGDEPFDAACAGVWLHSEAARLTGTAFAADDLLSRISEALSACL